MLVNAHAPLGRRPGAIVALSMLLAMPTGATPTYVPEQVICKVAGSFDVSEVNLTYGTTVVDWLGSTSIYLLATQPGDDALTIAMMMQSDHRIETAHVNYHSFSPEAARQMPLAAVGGTEADFEDQGAAERLGIGDAHAVSLGAGTQVAVLDTGVDLVHPRLSPQLVPGFDFVDHDTWPDEEMNGLDENDDGLVDGGFGHGTMVAGIISLVAPEADIVPVRVLGDEGIGNAWNAIEGVRYAADQGVDVMNLSFGTPAEVPLLSDEIERASVMGVFVVAAAGNQSTDTAPYHPAAHEKALMITAVDSLDVKADFADWHEVVLVCAPGTGIRSTYPGGGWALGSGCSFAAPFVAGEVALLVALAPQASKSWVVERVAESVDDVYALPENAPYVGELGTGRVDVGGAIATVAVGDAQPGISPMRLRVWPNPSAGRIGIHLGEVIGEDARVEIFDSSGRLVTRLDAAGSTIVWDGRDALGRGVASGVYHVRLVGSGTSSTGRVEILR